MSSSLRILAIGAHPDDCDLGSGGLAALFARAGHQVDFVSVTNGDAGHYQVGGAPLARRRNAEAQAAAQVAGIRYTVLDIHDGELEPTLANRKMIIQLIREKAPDLLLTHRPSNYHPDMRYTSQLVQDAAYMVTVPGIAGLTPTIAANPVILYMRDQFQRPYPFQPDLVLSIDEVVEVKMAMIFQHASQMLEWQPYSRGALDQVPQAAADQLDWVRDRYMARDAGCADRYRDQLLQTYGQEPGAQVRFAEAFECSEYGAPLTEESRRRLFPFLP